MIKLKNIKEDIKIKVRINILRYSLVFVVSILVIISILSISKTKEKIKKINEESIQNSIKISQLTERLYSIIIENHILLGSKKHLSRIELNRLLDTEQTQIYLSSLEEVIKQNISTELLNDFLTEFRNYTNITREIAILQRDSQDSLISVIRSTKEITSFRKVKEIVQRIILLNSETINVNISGIYRYQNYRIIMILVISIFIIIIVYFISNFLLNNLRKSVYGLKEHLSIISSGNIPENKLIENRNEIGIMSESCNKITTNLSKLGKLTKEIQKGNYSYTYNFDNENNILGNELLKLQENLKKTKIDEDKRKIEDERRNWATKGLAMFGEILRHSTGNINKLADQIIQNIVKYINANQGGIFIYNDSNPSDVYLELLSAFAYDRKKFFEKKINLGDGIIGMCAIEKETVYLTEIPKDYIEIESGLGEAQPNSLLVFPLKLENEILGIVEIASFNKFKIYEIKFLEKLAESIASTLSTAKINERTAKLLDESRKQSEELAIQEQEMRMNIDEMHSTQKEVIQREAELRGVLVAVDNNLMKSEYNIDGTLITANRRHLKTMGYSLNEIKGKNIEMFIPTDEIDEFRKIWKSVCAGYPHQIEVKRRAKTGEILWLQNQYTPIQDENRNVLKILFVAHNITEHKKREIELETKSKKLIEQEEVMLKNFNKLKATQNEIQNKNAEITSVLKTLNQSALVAEFDMSGKIIRISDSFLELFNMKKEHVLGLNHKYFSMGQEEIDFNEFWIDLNNGITKRIIEHLKLPTGKEVWLDEIYAPILNDKGEALKVLNIAIDITQNQIIQENNKKIIQESKQKAELLSVHKEKLRNNLEELETAQKIMALKESEIQGILDAIDNNIIKCEYSVHGKLLNANELFLSTMGYKFDEIDNVDCKIFIPNEEKNNYNKIWSKVIKGETYQGIRKKIRKDKSIVWLLMSYTPVKDTSGNINKIIYLANNITEQKQRENEILETTKKLKEHEELMKQKIEKITTVHKKTEEELNQYKNKQENITKNFNSEIDNLYSNWLNKIYEK